MPRVKRGKGHLKRRKNLLKQVKGYRWGRKSKIKLARTAMLKAGVYAYRDRRNKKREIKKTWQIKINAASRENSISYSKLMGALRKKSIELDKKILANLAEHHPAVFAKVAEEAK
ncbi:50S ribosomal protein L20 [Candidatus Falkowbacteria bacterium RIFOXYB2_FULL_38_15]|uniref:Large ribosomal subunit protein bL20 n=1 Tax=Candidatus Falkowbacteria bacterium RIFOXYA2_FULL_38_12 TaxID=1797993 RepID=A0A1F5S380_9BACT|nr:MAG: 50S ribosomal protein L20 [Candidatus Falkowbacteria bacterium RIFOXYA2_FULL_38_12]OGF32713.1 MAG: 50S ribosomal protein L20 [Candidatus Falkowbacteria bacterium RIFOXYB2_FULL_38_15]OGF42251.1 MAG: 50S ribosomal protein L20 [Candidatus Falkowbacteria bacterium RIFOXYD2_FULL_39_16]